MLARRRWRGWPLGLLLLASVASPTSLLQANVAVVPRSAAAGATNRTGEALAVGSESKVMVVGSGTDLDGVVDVYRRAASGTDQWTLLKTLDGSEATLPNGVAASELREFGAAVAIGGRPAKWILVGAPGSRRVFGSTPTATARVDVGRALVYSRDPISGSVTYAVTLEPGTSSFGLTALQRFGTSVAASSDDDCTFIAIGNPGYYVGQGAVQLFRRSALSDQWGKSNTLEPEGDNIEASMRFGSVLALGAWGQQTAYLGVGVPRADALQRDYVAGPITKRVRGAGRVFVYRFEGVIVRLDEILERPLDVTGAGIPHARFGAAVSFGQFDSKIIVVGAPGAQRACVYKKTETRAGWTIRPALWTTTRDTCLRANDDGGCSSGQRCNTSYGAAVAIGSSGETLTDIASRYQRGSDGNVILIGAPHANVGDMWSAGRIYPYRFTAGTSASDLQQYSALRAIAAAASPGASFGSSLAIAPYGPSDGRAWVLVGAPTRAGDGGSVVAYAVDGSGANWDTGSPTTEPTASPTWRPSAAPTVAPTVAPSTSPSTAPTLAPTASPSTVPTTGPTITSLSPAQVCSL